MMPRTIRGLIAVGGVAMGSLTIILGIATYYFANKSLIDQINTRIAAESRALIAVGTLPEIAAAVTAREAQPSAGNLGYIVVDSRGRRIAGKLRANVPPSGYWDCLDYRRGDGSPAVAQSLNSMLTGGGRLIVAADRTIVDEADGTILILFGATFGLILLCGFGSAYLLGRVVEHRLAEITAAADAIMAGDFSKRIPIEHERGEFDQLSAVFNRMLDRIEILLGNLRRLSVGIAHDIRSPLNRARAEMEAAERGAEGQPHQTVFAASIREVDEVLDLLRALLGISEIEGFAARKRFVPVDLGVVAEDVAEGYQSVVESAGMTIATETSTLMILGDPALLRRMLANLIDNTILHTPAGTSIRVDAQAIDDRAALTITDDGPGVPAHERENIFSRFVRLDTSRTMPGHGLGLNLVSAVAEAHRGKVRVVPTEIGLSIEILLPLLRRNIQDDHARKAS